MTERSRPLFNQDAPGGAGGDSQFHSAGAGAGAGSDSSPGSGFGAGGEGVAPAPEMIGAADNPTLRQGQPAPFAMPDFTGKNGEAAQRAIELLSDVNLNVKIELGRTKMLVDDVLRLAEGVVVELDKLAGDPVDIYVNERHIARGEVLVLNDNFCVRINEILPVQPESKQAG